MNDERWQRLDEIFSAATALSSDERAALLDRACADDPQLRAEVERLIAAHDRAGAFLETPALAAAASQPTETADSGASRHFGPYRVIREIAHGGMGAVYLAERADGEYEQRVAIKLIKHGMDLDLVVRRFRAERQILASLEHPHIARLVDGGTTEEGRPYFVMEYVEGEPIDVYAHAHGLSIPDRLRLFLKVCDAVAYAHRRRVIHRDIKPANLLVTAAGVPKLLDFGIAKVVETDVDGATSAITGFRVLTPEYASPEQVEGRQATVASDVYSLGVVLYELLTGRSPYHPRSRDPLEVAEAVRTTEPARPSAALLQSAPGVVPVLRRPNGADVGASAPSTSVLSRQLRGDLDTIVLAALRKEPGRRYQTVDEVAEDIRRHLDHQPIRARPDGLGYRAGKFARRNRAALLAAAVTGVAASAVLGLVLLSSRSAAAEDSLIGSGVLTARDRVLVADFADRAGDASLAAAVTDAFRIDLNQSPLIVVLTPAQVRAALGRMNLRADAVLDDSLAHEVALREGAKAVVTGSIAKVGGAYTISVQLVGAERGDALTGYRETAADSSKLLAAVDRASKALRQRIGESLGDLQDLPALEEVTTASLPALRSYTAGYRLFTAGERRGALRLLEQAVALDTGFASAHFAMASIYAALAEPGRQWAAVAHTLANRDRLPFRERQFVVGSTAYAREDYQAAIDDYDLVLERYPNLVAALNNLALAYRDSRRFAVAESLWHRAIQQDSTIGVLYYGLHSTQAFQGKFDESRRTLDLIGRRFPDDPVRLIVEVQDAAARQAWQEAEDRARANIGAKQGDTLALVDAHEQLAGIAMTRGRLPEAERLWRTHLTMSAAADSRGRHLFGVRQLAALELRYRARPDRARAFMDSVLASQPLDSLLPGDRPHYELARSYASLGEVARARALVEAGEANERMLGRNRRAELQWTEGVIHLAEGRLGDARAALEQAAEIHSCPICPLPDLARTLEAAGELDAAARIYERYIATPWLWRYENDAVELGFTLQRLGELYEQRGETARASAAYTQLLELWQHADEETVPQVDVAKRRLANLRSG